MSATSKEDKGRLERLLMNLVEATKHTSIETLEQYHNRIRQCIGQHKKNESKEPLLEVRNWSGWKVGCWPWFIKGSTSDHFSRLVFLFSCSQNPSINHLNFYCISQIDNIFPCVCTVIEITEDVTACEEQKGTTRNEVEWRDCCCLHAVTSSVQYTHTRKKVIYLFYTVKIQMVYWRILGAWKKKNKSADVDLTPSVCVSFNELNVDNWNDNCEAKIEAKSPRPLHGLQVDFSLTRNVSYAVR